MPNFFLILEHVPQTVKNSPGNTEDLGLIPGPGRSPGEENGNPPQYSCLENSMDRGARQATVHEVTKSQTRLSKNTFFSYLINNVVLVPGVQKSYIYIYIYIYIYDMYIYIYDMYTLQCLK